MKILRIIQRDTLPDMGKLAKGFLTVTVDHEKTYEVKNGELGIPVSEGVHTLEFAVNVSSLFVKIPFKKVEKVLEIFNDQEIDITFSKGNISVDVKESIEASNDDTSTKEIFIPESSSQSENYEFENISTTYIRSEEMKEYKVLTQKDKFIGGKFDPVKLETALNSYAEQGWRVVATATAQVPGLAGNREEIILVMERDK
jgi:hypothetical protein